MFYLRANRFAVDASKEMHVTASRIKTLVLLPRYQTIVSLIFMVSFPAPVGGIVYPHDYAPSILFATLYGLLVPLIIYRVLDRRSRTTLLIGTILFSVERIVVYIFRALQAHSERRRVSKRPIEYLQISFGLGFVGIASDLVSIVRCLIVNATYGSDRYAESPAAASKGGIMTAPPEGTPDLPRTRYWARRFTDFWGLAFIAATVTGSVVNSQYYKAVTDQAWADKVATIRFASTAICFSLTLALASFVCLGKYKLKRISKRAVTVFGILVCFICIIAIYRMSVMPTRISSLTERSRLNTPQGKAAFYIFHVLPEWLATVTLFSVNIRKTFGTGLAGDWHYRDETEKERKKRITSEDKRRAKKAAREAANRSDNVIELTEKGKLVMQQA